MTSQNDSNRLTLANLDENLKKELIDELFKKMEEEKETKRKNRCCPDGDIPLWVPLILLFIVCIPYIVSLVVTVYLYFTCTDEEFEKFRNDVDKLVELFKNITGRNPVSFD